MRFTPVLAALVSLAMVEYASANEPKFTKLRQVFDVRIITDRSVRLEYDEDHGFNFTADQTLCEKAVTYARLDFDKDGTIGTCRPYKIIFSEDSNSTSDLNVLKCPGKNDTACYVRKMKRDTDEFKVYALTHSKLTVLAGTSEVDRLYYEAGGPST